MNKTLIQGENSKDMRSTTEDQRKIYSFYKNKNDYTQITYFSRMLN